MRRLVASIGIFLLLALGAAAEDKITVETDHTLWCASAFALLANDASEEADAVETELYDSLAATLTQKGIELLRSQKFGDDRIGSIIQAYDDTVYVELGTPEARYPIETCEPLAQG